MKREIDLERLTLILLKNAWRLPGLWLKLCKYAKHPDNYPEILRYRHIQHAFQLGIRSGNIDFQVFGKENIPADEPYMMYPNHQGKFDPMAIVASCDVPMGVVMKKELVDHPVLRRILECTHSFGMDRENVRQSLTVINAVIEQIKLGRSYVIFPEGEANRHTNEVGEFHHGCFRCATKTGCTVVPVALINCFKPLDYAGTDPVTVQVHYLKPIPYEEYRGMNTRDLAALVRRRIVEAIALHCPESSYAEKPIPTV